MQAIHKLEDIIAGWYAQVPHLPPEGRKWLAQNVWWIVLIGVICGAIALISVFFFTLLAGTALTALGGAMGAAIGTVIFLGVLTSTLVGAVCVVLGAMAINPLRALQKKGWKLLFVVMLLEAVAMILSNLLSNAIVNLIWGLLWSAAWGYFLFEIRDAFQMKTVKKVKAAQKQ